MTKMVHAMVAVRLLGREGQQQLLHRAGLPTFQLVQMRVGAININTDTSVREIGSRAGENANVECEDYLFQAV